MPLAYQFHPGKGLASLEAVTVPRRKLQPNEVRVAVRAASLNYRDIQIARGQYPAPTDRPVVPCSDGAGTIVEMGEAVGNRFALGDHVVSSFFHRWQDGPPTPEMIAISGGCNVDGWLAEEVVIDAAALVHVPKGVSSATAACTPCAGVTAWVAMFDAARLEAGSTVVIPGTGGVAMWAALLARVSGIKAIVVSSSKSKAATIQPTENLCVSYVEQPQWADSVLELTGGRGADLVIELGGTSTINESLRSVGFGGHVAAIGGLSGWTYNSVEPLGLIVKMATLHGIFVGSGASLRHLLDFVAAHRLEPHISHTYPFADAPAALSVFEAGRHIGKIVVEVS